MYILHLGTSAKNGVDLRLPGQFIFDGQESPMLHSKFRENRPAGSGAEEF